LRRQQGRCRDDARDEASRRSLAGLLVELVPRMHTTAAKEEEDGYRRYDMVVRLRNARERVNDDESQIIFCAIAPFWGMRHRGGVSGDF
jgi:hypothetical protein